MALDWSNRNDLQDDSYSQHPITYLFLGFRARVLRAFGAKNASGPLGSALVANEQPRRVG